jgi:hypothetical protein
MPLKKILNDCFTGKNDNTHDLFKYLFALGFFVICYVAIKTHASIVEVGGTLGSYFTLGASALYIKKSTEPEK